MPRLNREDEAALCKDVQRWRRLEELREDVSAEEASATGGDPGTRAGLEAWAAAAGVDVAVRARCWGACEELSFKLELK